MPEPVIYFRGLPHAHPVEGLTSSPSGLADLKAIAELTDETIEALSRKLSEAEGFLGTRPLAALVGRVVPDQDVAGSVQRILQYIGPDHVDRLLKLAREQSEGDSPLDETTLLNLRRVVPKLIQEYPALVRFGKAERLAKLTGQELESVELVCDLRPIFDEKQEVIEGIMPYTRLHIVATGEDGLPKSFEAELTQQQVHDLSEKARKAKLKLDVLRESVETWVPGGLPELPLTRIPRKESSDA